MQDRFWVSQATGLKLKLMFENVNLKDLPMAGQDRKSVAGSGK